MIEHRKYMRMDELTTGDEFIDGVKHTVILARSHGFSTILVTQTAPGQYERMINKKYKTVRMA